ncbi:hypothetical protein CVT24_002909, partial [Panaeolus cyanescens]
MMDDIESLDDIYVTLEEEKRQVQSTRNTTPSQTHAALSILNGALGIRAEESTPPKPIPIPIQHLFPGDNDSTLLAESNTARQATSSHPNHPYPSQHQRARSNSTPHHPLAREIERGRDKTEAHTSTPKRSGKTKEPKRSHRKHSSTRRLLEELNIQLQLHDLEMDGVGPSQPYITKDAPPTRSHPRTRTYTTTTRSSDSISTMLAVTSERLQQETRRANEAEKQAEDVLRLFKEMVEGKNRTERELKKRRDEEVLWRTRLDEAQAEINRAQNVVAQIDKQRIDAEDEARRLREKLRKLYEERAVENARDEGRRAGFEEGLRQGRMLGVVSSIASSEKERERSEERERQREQRRLEEEARRRDEEEEESRREEERRRNEERELEERRRRDEEEQRRKEEEEQKIERDRKRHEEAERIARERLREQFERNKNETATQSSKDSVKNLRPRRVSNAHTALYNPPPLPAPPTQHNLKPSFPIPLTMPQPETTNKDANPLPQPPIPITPSNLRSPSPPKPTSPPNTEHRNTNRNA